MASASSSSADNSIETSSRAAFAPSSTDSVGDAIGEEEATLGDESATISNASASRYFDSVSHSSLKEHIQQDDPVSSQGGSQNSIAQLSEQERIANSGFTEQSLENDLSIPISETAKAPSDINRLAEDPNAQFPSPSSGFVPPVTQEDFQLQQVPASASKAKHRGSDIIDRAKTPTIHTTNADEAIPTIATSTETSGISAMLQNEKKSVLGRSGASRDSSSLSLLSSSSSSSSFDDGHSQAISARSSPSTVAPQRRRSSASPISGSATSQHDLEQYMIPLKIRDYAFEEVDPRHVGARDITISSSQDDPLMRSGLHQHELGQEEEGEEEEVEAIQEAGLPPGLYHAAYDFAAESEHELSVQAGEKLRLIGHVEGGWAIVVRIAAGQEDAIINEDDVPRSDKGLVPEAYLEWLG